MALEYIAGHINLGADSDGNVIGWMLARSEQEQLQVDGTIATVQGPPIWRRSELEFRTPQVAQGPVTSANLPTQIGESHEINSWGGGFGQAAQEPGVATEGYRFTKDGDASNGVFVRPSPRQNAITINGTANCTHIIEFKDELYFAAGEHLKKSDTSGVITIVSSLGVNEIITDMVVFRGDDAERLYVATQTNALYSYDGTTMTADTRNINTTPLIAMFTQDDGGTYTEDATAPLTLTLNSLDTLANGDWIIVGHNEVFEGVRITVNAANGNTSVMRADYWDGDSWVQVGNISDETSVGGVTLAQTGNVIWDPISIMGSSVISGTRMLPIRLTFSAALDSSVSTTDIDIIEQSRAIKLLATTDTTSALGAQLYRTYLDLGRPAIAQSVNGGTAPTWAGALIFGEQGEVVTNLHVVRGRIVIETDRDVYTLAADFKSLVEALRPEDRDAISTDNGRGSASIEGRLFLARQNALLAFDPTKVDGPNMPHVGIETLAQNDTPASGRVTAMTHDGYFLIAAIYNGADTYLMRFPYAVAGAEQRWHTWIHLVGKQCDALRVTEFISGSKRLYYGSGVDAGYVELPRFGHDPDGENETTPEYPDQWELYIPTTLTDLPQHDTNWLRISVEAEGISSSNRVQIFYKEDGASAYTSVGHLTAAGYRDLPSDLNTSRLAIYLLVEGTSSTQVKIRSVAVEFRKVAPYFRTFAFAVDMGATVNTFGVKDNRTITDRINLMDTIVGDRALVKCDTPESQRFNVFVRDLGESPIRALPVFAGESVRYVEAIEYTKLDTEGTWDDLDAFSWASLEEYTWSSLDEVRAA